MKKKDYNYAITDSPPPLSNPTKHYSYPTILGFHLIIQHFDTKFTTITTHSLVMFQLQHGQQVKNKLPINNPHIGLTKYIYQ